MFDKLQFTRFKFVEVLMVIVDIVVSCNKNKKIISHTIFRVYTKWVKYLTMFICYN